jgi:DNA-binding phage protein
VARTGAERYFAEQLEDPEYRRAYEVAKARIRQTDAIVRTLDERRIALGMSKADLARSAGMQPEAVRRLFTMESPNPTAGTLLALADVLDLEVVAQPKQRRAKRPSGERSVAAQA